MKFNILTVLVTFTIGHVSLASTKSNLNHMLNAQSYEEISMKLLAIYQNTEACDLLKDAMKYSRKGLTEALKVGRHPEAEKKLESKINDLNVKFHDCIKKQSK